ncbi:MAG: hypothetical protein R3D00_20670 [Bacteroidia bacterium]
MKNLILAFFAFFFISNLSAQMTESIIPLEAQSGELLEVSGNLSDGQPMPTLDWAWNSSVACFPKNHEKNFTGNHVLYTIDLPAYSEMEIAVVPADKKTNLSVYAYMVREITEENTVPNLNRCVRCEVDHASNIKRQGQAPGTRVVKDILALKNPYQVLIGVTGAEGLSEGAYTLKVRVKGK